MEDVKVKEEEEEKEDKTQETILTTNSLFLFIITALTASEHPSEAP